MPHEAVGCIGKIQVQLLFSGVLFVTIYLGIGVGVQFSVAEFCPLLEICPPGQTPREIAKTLHL